MALQSYYPAPKFDPEWKWFRCCFCGEFSRTSTGGDGECSNKDCKGASTEWTPGEIKGGRVKKGEEVTLPHPRYHRDGWNGWCVPAVRRWICPDCGSYNDEKEDICLRLVHSGLICGRARKDDDEYRYEKKHYEFWECCICGFRNMPSDGGCLSCSHNRKHTDGDETGQAGTCPEGVFKWKCTLTKTSATSELVPPNHPPPHPPPHWNSLYTPACVKRVVRFSRVKRRDIVELCNIKFRPPTSRVGSFLRAWECKKEKCPRNGHPILEVLGHCPQKNCDGTRKDGQRIWVRVPDLDPRAYPDVHPGRKPPPTDVPIKLRRKSSKRKSSTKPSWWRLGRSSKSKSAKPKDEKTKAHEEKSRRRSSKPESPVKADQPRRQSSKLDSPTETHRSKEGNSSKSGSGKGKDKKTDALDKKMQKLSIKPGSPTKTDRPKEGSSSKSKSARAKDKAKAIAEEPHYLDEEADDYEGYDDDGYHYSDPYIDPYGDYYGDPYSDPYGDSYGRFCECEECDEDEESDDEEPQRSSSKLSSPTEIHQSEIGSGSRPSGAKPQLFVDTELPTKRVGKRKDKQKGSISSPGPASPTKFAIIEKPEGKSVTQITRRKKR